MDIRERIKLIIAENKDMSIRSVSLKAGLSDSMLHKLLKGDVKSPTLETVDKLAEALNVDAMWLAYGEGTSDRATDIGNIFAAMPTQEQETALRILRAYAEDVRRRA